jgi:hypothetical protein
MLVYFLTPLSNACRFCCDFLEGAGGYFTFSALVNGMLIMGPRVFDLSTRMSRPKNRFGFGCLTPNLFFKKPLHFTSLSQSSFTVSGRGHCDNTVEKKTQIFNYCNNNPRHEPLLLTFHLHSMCP